jgi:hypothetical protein
MRTAKPKALDALIATRRTLHGIAEHILAGYERSVNDWIHLSVTDSGLRTQRVAGDPEMLELTVDPRGAATLVRHPDGRAVPVRGRLGDLAADLGVGFGLPNPPYPPASGCDADDEAVLDAEALQILIRSWRDGDTALRRFAAAHGGTQPPEPVVWPEHFDVGVTIDDVNYGVSPGDEHIAEPYAYVGPHRPRTGPFWNEPFGAARPLSQLPDADAILAFFEHGRDELVLDDQP